MAKIYFIDDAVRSRRQAAQREVDERCIEIVRLNLTLALHHFNHGPEEERPVRARQIRQLGEILEYMSA